VLSDGRFLLGNTQGWGYQIALLNPSTLTWAVVGTLAVPTGNQDIEQTYTLVQTGDVLTTGVYNPTSMRYNSTANSYLMRQYRLCLVLTLPLPARKPGLHYR
jgi:hypothetical protein